MTSPGICFFLGARFEEQTSSLLSSLPMFQLLFFRPPLRTSSLHFLSDSRFLLSVDSSIPGSRRTECASLLQCATVHVCVCTVCACVRVRA